MGARQPGSAVGSLRGSAAILATEENPQRSLQLRGPPTATAATATPPRPTLAQRSGAALRPDWGLKRP
ncbi:unnamed protein product [Lampetra fluviatilis]